MSRCFVALCVLIMASVIHTSGQTTAESWFEKGNQFFADGSYEDAVKAYDKAIRLNPSYVEAWYNKGTALQKLGRGDDAEKAFTKSEELFSKQQTDPEKDIVSPTATEVKNPTKEIKVPEKHTYQAGTPGINEFTINWTDNKIYTEIFPSRHFGALIVFDTSEASDLLQERIHKPSHHACHKIDFIRIRYSYKHLCALDIGLMERGRRRSTSQKSLNIKVIRDEIHPLRILVDYDNILFLKG